MSPAKTSGAPEPDLVVASSSASATDTHDSSEVSVAELAAENPAHEIARQPQQEPPPEPSLVDQSKALVARIQRTRPVRAIKRYGDNRGALIAGGMAYISLFSVGAALVVGFTLLNTFLASQPELKDSVIAETAKSLPGLLTVDGKEGLVSPEALFKSDIWSPAALISLAVALWTGSGWLNAVREGIRAMFRFPVDEAFFLRKKVKDFGIMAIIGTLVLLSAMTGTVVNSAADAILASLGLADSTVGRVVLPFLAFVVMVVLDTVVLVVLLRLLAGIKVPWQIYVQGACFGAVLLALLKTFSSTLLGQAGGSNPVLAGSAILIGLVVWLNLTARVTLAAAAWAAESALDAGVEAVVEANYGPLRRQPSADYDDPIGPLPAPIMPAGRRPIDKFTLGAGVVLGAAVLTGVRAVRSLKGKPETDDH